MGTLSEDVDAAAIWMAVTLSKAGYLADFSLASLREVERSLTEHTRERSPDPQGLYGTDTNQRVFAVGAYIGEVMRRNLGGKWQRDPNSPDSRIGAQLVLPGGTIIWPVRRALARIASGPEDSITAYGAALIALQDPPTAATDGEPNTAGPTDTPELLLKGYAVASILIPLAGLFAFTLVACATGLILGALTRKYAPVRSRWRILGSVGYAVATIVLLLFLVQHSGLLPNHH